ncbi:MAG: phosphate acyltransferase PlsX [Limnochordia bacterium]|nr:phosphate acyltransferase PlsX [Limnochordia bacterium]
MKIALDAMGGDFAPEEQVKGAVMAANDLGIETILVGRRSCLEPLVEQYGADAGLTIEDAPDVVDMAESPLRAVRSKPNSSLMVGARLVQEGKAVGLVSCGNTGATMAAALLSWGKVSGIERPAIGTIMPTAKGACTLVDVGANTDSRPKHLLHFAIMGALYSEKVLGVSNPTVGLLNVGEEPGKGSAVVKEAHGLLGKSGLNFIGNIEGHRIFEGDCDVVVCDGFTGNAVLKSAEGLVQGVLSIIKEEFTRDFRSKCGGILAKPVFSRVKQKMDYTEYGGAPLLGLDGVCIVSHGRSDAKAVMNGLRVAKQTAEGNLPQLITFYVEEKVGQ